ncbi:MAG: DNA translocase FtsK 4TM domain-containing protein [Bryobacterales bacterium]|nr:DNA translocase FtsK 4TM domain-containing protein [Bryobacterales bacterium]MBV9401977.1 DNA translocase FtsK 4TM domain-containing protein [Bryobacterales bacterium]
MNYLGPTRHPRLNEAIAVVYLFAGLFIFLSLASYHPFDPSLNTASGLSKPVNLTGRAGAYFADFFLQTLGLAAYSIPFFMWAIGWKWLRSRPIGSAWAKVLGALMLMCSSCTGLALLLPEWRPIAHMIPAGGLLGVLAAGSLSASLNLIGAVIATAACWILSLYLVSRFEMARLPVWFRAPLGWWRRFSARVAAWREERVRQAHMRAQARILKKKLESEKTSAPKPQPAAPAQAEPVAEPPIVDPLGDTEPAASDAPPWGDAEDIPIRALETPPPAERDTPAPAPVLVIPERRGREAERPARTEFRLPPTDLLQEPPARSAYDSQELKDIAARIKSKFEEFNVLGSVVQINPGPVVTTFEFKPEAGMKYSRIITLTEDLCLGLQAESILIERIPGKPTVGIEVPNSKREVIALRQILESDEFLNSPSPLTVALGKDINGRIKVAALDSMPHLLIAGSTGSGKSVMLNSLIMSILYKAKPDQVRMIMVDPKRLEFGLYEGIPHLLTPVITDAKKATNALRNAVLEMERRLKLLASQGVRNIEQYNRKVRQLQAQPRSLFEQETTEEEELEPIPYVLILIDELADLMMLERANVEESVTRLAQMARAVGMHLVLATQRPSVDVITGLIKANFPSRISFRVATRVDSRTVLDVMGAEHLLGKGDMLFLPPGSSRLVRVHGSYVSESETNDVVEFWKQQAAPEYDQSFLIAPPTDDEENAEEFDGPEDPMYQEAVRIVCEMGKASTSTLQRRLRLGYGRAARILDMMQRDGIIGPPDGSRPRDVLKRPDWLSEVENQLK